ncbi:AraC family transcriptional regulator [Galbibacter sp. PAP.153]|uniref:AraC family transcriptional regulator n=1 Tax=Galbibacter sp. PAP.153 TaxID=3104623 RepID=UPI0030093189
MVTIETFGEDIDITTPKRMMKYVLIWCSSGNAIVVVDDKELKLEPHAVITITSGQVHYFKNAHNAKGYILEFTLDYFCKDDNDIELVFQNGLFCHFAMNEVITIENFKFLEEQLRKIEDELKQKPYQYLISVHSRIELVLIEINRSKIKQGNEIWKPDALFLKFLELVRANFEEQYSISKYAQLLETTESKLNEQSKLFTGKTAQNVVYGLIVSEAKRLLTYEKLIVKEVAFNLGFSDPFYFSNFFKRYVGMSPKAYQTQYAIVN